MCGRLNKKQEAIMGITPETYHRRKQQELDKKNLAEFGDPNYSDMDMDNIDLTPHGSLKLENSNFQSALPEMNLYIKPKGQSHKKQSSEKTKLNKKSDTKVQSISQQQSSETEEPDTFSSKLSQIMQAKWSQYIVVRKDSLFFHAFKVLVIILGFCSSIIYAFFAVSRTDKDLQTAHSDLKEYQMLSHQQIKINN